MQLRAWQAECINKALNLYSSGNNHFMCLATPGAGKTTMAAVLAKELFEQQLIDIVLCLSPSSIVSHDFRTELEKQCAKRLDGSLGSHGCALTYQGMLCLSNDFWDLLAEHRVFIIFDEIHHCAGREFSRTNSWGEKIITHIQGKAAYTLALTGTPWRSDSIPIVLSSYCENKRVQCDYSYSLTQAINDNVCRTPHITMIDNERISFEHQGNIEKFGSFKEILCEKACRYQSLIENDELLKYMLKTANRKLDNLRRNIPDAGGLIVASSVRHARKIHKILATSLSEHADIATYQEQDPAAIIHSYKHSLNKWIISVGMISEGTNIPRLQVCCHLSRVKTELYFRQVLGRILRASQKRGETGYLYMPAEPSLVEYAYRVADDVPHQRAVEFDTVKVASAPPIESRLVETMLDSDPPNFVLDDFELLSWPELSDSPKGGTLSSSYEETLGVFGRFKEEVFLLGVD